MDSQAVFANPPHPLGLPAHRYSLPVEVLGNGTFGQVFRCCLRSAPSPHDRPEHAAPQHYHDQAQHQDGGSDQWVAVKLFKPFVECSDEEMGYFTRELLCQRRLQHNHVIGFREVGITESGCPRFFLALEYADAGTLGTELAKQPGGRLAEADARWYTQQLVFGLAYCHSEGVFNRDIKPENLLLHGAEYSARLLKVADFGTCKRKEDSVPKSYVGTPNYMAPEVIRGGKGKGGYDGGKADVFSCGVVLYQMVFGALPFNRSRADGRPLSLWSNCAEMMANMAGDAWRELLPQPAVCVSDSLMDLLAGMLRFDPDKRLSLYQVKRHAWYRGDLDEEGYQYLLRGDTDPAEAPAEAGAGAQQQQAEQLDADGPDGAVQGQSAACIKALFAAAQELRRPLQEERWAAARARDAAAEVEAEDWDEEALTS